MGPDGWASDRQIGRASLTIGRSSSCDIVIPHSRVSRRHARIETHPDGKVSIRDLGSRNRVFVNGARVAEAYLKPGDEVAIGPVSFHVLTHAGGSPAHERGLAPTPAVPEFPVGSAPSAAPHSVIPAGQVDAAAAERAYRQAIAAGQTSAHNHLGLLLQSQGDLTGAEGEYRKALDAGHGAAAYNLSNLLLRRGDTGGSQAMLQRGRAATPSAPAASLPMPPLPV